MDPVSFQNLEASFLEEKNSIPEIANIAENKIFSESLVQLQLMIDPILDLYHLLKPVIDFIPSDYTLLCVTEDTLTYYTPKSFFGSYSHGKEVIKYLEKKIFLIQQTYQEITPTKRWKILKISRLFLEGIKKIIENYSHKSNYNEFISDLQTINNRLETYITEKSNFLNFHLNFYLCKGFIIKNYFHLLNFHADFYSIELVKDILKQEYGERLINHIFKDYDNDIIYYDHAFKIMFSIATLVSYDDLKWYYYKYKYKNKEFDELNSEEIKAILNHFQLTPEKLNFLEFFSIPITYDKYNVHPSFIELNTPKNIFEQNLLNEINVYCDLMSYVIWNPCEIMQMSPLQIYDNLSKFIDGFTDTHLFHTDRYINFITIARTILSYFHLCNDREERVERFEIIKEKIIEVINKCHEIYPESHVEKYKYCWNSLLGEINQKLEVEEYDFKPFFKNLITHPLENELNKKETIEIYSSLQPYEFLARRVAYLNRYYFESSFYLNEEKKLAEETFISQRNGTFIRLPQINQLLIVHKTIYREGFCCQITGPLNSNNENYDFYLLFQGTIENENSKKRDYYFNGAGYELWQKENKNLVINDLLSLIKDFKEKYKSFKLHFIGHSLGGSDAQNALSFLGETFVSASLKKEHIQEINLHTFNSAGVPKETIDRFNLNFSNFSFQIGKITHSIVKNDIVSKSNAGKIGLDFPCQEKIVLIEISNLGLFHFLNNHCDYIYSCTNNVLPHRVLNYNSHDHIKLIKKYLCGAAYSWSTLGSHLHDIKDSNPYLKTAYSIALFAGFSYLSAQLGPLSQAIICTAGSMSQGGIGILKSTGDSFARDKMKDAIVEIKEATYQKWYGSQILEGTG